MSQVESEYIGAENDRQNAAEYFNFLLNRNLGSSIETDSSLMTYTPPTSSDDGVPADLTTRREEFDRLKSYQRTLQSNLKWDRNYLIPKLSAFYDVGYQGYGFHFNGTQFYQLAGVQLSWSLFKAGDNKYKIQQARIDIDAIDEQYQQLTQQLTLEQQTAANNYHSALEALRSLADETESAREVYRLVEKRFNEGQALQVDLIDARTQMTNAGIRYSLGRLAVLNRAADLERANATYKF